ncbi:phosphatase PAP2 family protein [bacterium]|nr:MAG: phosphatase PAP2 family protein [bacterium]
MLKLSALRLTLVPIFLGAVSLAPGQDLSKAVSGPFTYAYLTAGLALPLLRDGESGRQRSFRTLDALGSTFLITEGLKSIVRERRPDGSDRQSFPSAHASLAFTVATMQADFRPREAVYWYLGASMIGASRVDLRKHHVHDVLAGAALGYGIARLELSLPRGLILQPLIGERKQYGLMISGRF